MSDDEKSNEALEMLAGMVTMATMVAAYYQSLINEDVPSDIAGVLAVAFQTEAIRGAFTSAREET